MNKKWMVLIWAIANIAILFAIFMNKQSPAQASPDTSSYEARIEDLLKRLKL